MDAYIRFILTKYNIFNNETRYFATLASFEHVTSPMRHFATRAIPFNPKRNAWTEKNYQLTKRSIGRNDVT